MERMKKFLIYLLLFLGFMAISLFLENGFIEGMYGQLTNAAKSEQAQQLVDENGNTMLTIEVENAKATRVNGYVNAKVKNTSGKFLEKAYAKIELSNKKNRILSTKYIDIDNLQANESRQYEIQFKANDVTQYKVSFMTELPQEEIIRRDSVIQLFGYSLDLTNLFNTGINLRDFFGMDLVEKFHLNAHKDLLTYDGLRNGIASLWDWGFEFATSIPLWAYIGGFTIVFFNIFL